MHLRNKRKISATLCGFLSVVMLVTGIIFKINTEKNQRYVPEYEKEDISFIFSAENLTEEQYKTLFFQTGLGKIAVDELFAQGKKAEILEYQKKFFSPQNVKCVREAITTNMEYTVDHDGKDVPGFDFAPYKAGYVFIMESSHSFGFRHGHAGLVIGTDQVLESPMVGVFSGIFSANEWRYYPTFVMLRLKDATDEQLKIIAKDAKKQLSGIRYNILAGLVSKTHGTVPPSTHCAHLVWYAFENYGTDIDCNGGKIVTVQDILYSDKFEVVQIYGYDPVKFWNN